jgi:hypothetical protein
LTQSCLAAAREAESTAPQPGDANFAAPQPGDANFAAPLQDDSDVAAPQLDLAAPLLGAAAVFVSSQPGSCDTTTLGHLHPTKRKDSSFKTSSRVYRT